MKRKKRPSQKQKKQHESDFLLSSPKSALVEAPLNAVLTNKLWDSLAESEKQVCLDLLPSIDRNEDGSLSRHFFERNVVLQDAIRDFQDQLAAGFFLESHIKKTVNATRKRIAGAADKFKDDQFELYWGQKCKVNHSCDAGAPQSLKLQNDRDETFQGRGRLQVCEDNP